MPSNMESDPISELPICRECHEGRIRPIAEPGRRVAIKLVYELPATFNLPTCDKCGQVFWTEEAIAQVRSLIATLPPATPRPGEMLPETVKVPQPLKDLVEDKSDCGNTQTKAA